MKRQAFVILTTLTLLVMLTAASVDAQSNPALVANIPFEFVIGTKAFPAGEYNFAPTQLGGADAVKIQSADGHVTAFVPTWTARVKEAQGEPKLVFNRYGDQYFLSTLWTEGDHIGRVVRMSRSERELIRVRSALVTSAPEPKIVSIVFHR